MVVRKDSRFVTLGLILGAAMFGPGFAHGFQDVPAATEAQADPQAQSAQQGQPTRLTKVSMLRDAKVVNAQGDRIADVDDLVMELQGRPLYVVLKIGGVGGVGGDSVPVPFGQVRFNLTPDVRWVATLDVPQERLNQAPRLDGDGRLLHDAAWRAKIDAYYQGQQGQPGAAQGADAAGAGQAGVFRASQVIDADLLGNGDERLADVLDIVVDQDYRARYLLAGTGGALGVGQAQIAIPFERVRLAPARDDPTRFIATLNIAKPQIEQAPRLGDQGFDALLDAGFRQRVQEYFGGGVNAQPQP